MMERKKKITFIINPVSGTSTKEKLPQLIESYLDHTIFDVEITFTEYAGHAAVITAERVARGIDVVVAVGGDGTVNEVARSLVGSSSALAIIPCGSGNGLARHLQIPLDPVAAIKIINADVIHCLDYGKINGEPFFCTCGVGFDAFISMKFAESKRRGLATYVEKTLKDGLNYKPATYTIEYEVPSESAEQTIVQHKAFLIACANASQYGNNAYIAPFASMKDGLLDVIIIKPFSTIEAPVVAVQLFNKKLHTNSHVKTFRTKRIKVTRNEEGPAHYDGDAFLTGKEIIIELVSKQFNVVVNPDAHKKNSQPLTEISHYFSSWKKPSDSFKRTTESIIRINSSLIDKLRNI